MQTCNKTKVLCFNIRGYSNKYHTVITVFLVKNALFQYMITDALLGLQRPRNSLY